LKPKRVIKISSEDEKKKDNITRIIVTNSESMLPSDVMMKVYHSSSDVTAKETCFGTMINGPIESVNKVVEDVVSMDPNHIFVKDRGFLPGDERRCRSSRGGGPRPGFHFLREEVNTLPLISKGLEAYYKGESPSSGFEAKQKLDAFKLKYIIESEEM